jgi:predicted nuclease with TOPRIM domain
MLTKEQIDYIRSRYEQDDFVRYTDMMELLDQAIHAIDLQAENEQIKDRLLHMDYADSTALHESVKGIARLADEVERLKAKLDEIRELCLGRMIGHGYFTTLDAILDIIDRGDGT